MTCWPRISVILSSLFILLILSCGPIAKAQQPFVTDDADVTPKGRFHFEFSNELDYLQHSAYPLLRQNTADFELDYGLFQDFEIGVELPVLSIFSAAGSLPGSTTGLGDLNLSAKYNFIKEREHSRMPAMTVTVNLELPTGDVKRQLGSGLMDLYINGVLQKSVTKRTTVRLNGGILFSGNETTGVIGISSRGTVLTGSASIVREFSPKVLLGLEVAGAAAKNLQLGKGQLQMLVGGNYQFRRNASFDFGLITGRYVASPRIGVQVGMSIDF